MAIKRIALQKPETAANVVDMGEEGNTKMNTEKAEKRISQPLWNYKIRRLFASLLMRGISN